MGVITRFWQFVVSVAIGELVVIRYYPVEANGKNYTTFTIGTLESVNELPTNSVGPYDHKVYRQFAIRPLYSIERDMNDWRDNIPTSQKFKFKGIETADCIMVSEGDRWPRLMGLRQFTKDFRINRADVLAYDRLARLANKKRAA